VRDEPPAARAGQRVDRGADAEQAAAGAHFRPGRAGCRAAARRSRAAAPPSRRPRSAAPARSSAGRACAGAHLSGPAAPAARCAPSRPCGRRPRPSNSKCAACAGTQIQLTRRHAHRIRIAHSSSTAGHADTCTRSTWPYLPTREETFARSYAWQEDLREREQQQRRARQPEGDSRHPPATAGAPHLPSFTGDAGARTALTSGQAVGLQELFGDAARRLTC